ncbi:MAG: MFS transporter, partial [Ktedonobacteraceae bacterium]|nr:MFS transporter [Ktedonobacteraceae bacterium]
VPGTRDLRVQRSIDLIGTLTLTGGIFCLVLAILQGNGWSWMSGPTLGLFGGALGCLVIFVIVELVQKNPLVDFSLFKSMTFSGTNLTMFLFGAAIQGAFLMIILYFTNARGYSGLEATYGLAPFPIASFVISILVGQLSNRMNPHIVGMVGSALISAGFVLLCFIDADTSYIDIAWRTVLLGAGMGMLFQCLPTIALLHVPRAKLGVGSGVFDTGRQIGFALGVAILVSVFTSNLAPNLNQARQRAIQMVRQDQKLPAPMRDQIAQQLEKVDLSSSHRGSNTNANQGSNLVKLADQLPPQTSAEQKTAIRTELKGIGNQIGHLFTNGVVDAFKAAWLVAAIVAAMSFVSALITLLSTVTRSFRK